MTSERSRASMTHSGWPTEPSAAIYILDNAGHLHRAQLRDALYIPSYPHDIFSVARAVNGGATITFQKEDSRMVTNNGSRFENSPKQGIGSETVRLRNLWNLCTLT